MPEIIDIKELDEEGLEFWIHSNFEIVTRCLTKRTFKVYFKRRYKVEDGVIFGKDLETARNKFEAYCDKWSIRFVSIHPYYIDLDRAPNPDESR